MPKPKSKPVNPQNEPTEPEAQSGEPYKQILVPYHDSRAIDLQHCLQALGVKVRYNLRSEAEEVSLDGEVWVELNDRRTAEIHTTIEAWCFYETTRKGEHGDFTVRKYRRIGSDLLNRNLASMSEDYDPFLQHLEKCVAMYPDAKEDKAEAFLETCFRLPIEAEREIARVMFRNFIRAMCRRALEPGFKYDLLMILLGEEGIGKSTIGEGLVPDPLMFVDTLRFSQRYKEQVEALQSAVIVEFSDLAGMSKADYGTMLSFLSRRLDKVRLSYGHRSTTSPRRAVFMGTFNPSGVGSLNLPTDAVGRRFVPITLERLKPGESSMDSRNRVVQHLIQYRDYMLAAGYIAAKKKLPCILPPQLERQSQANVEEHKVRNDAVEEALTEWLGGDPELGEKGFKMKDCLNGVSDMLPKSMRNLEYQLARILKRDKWTNSSRWNAEKQKTERLWRLETKDAEEEDGWDNPEEMGFKRLGLKDPEDFDRYV